MKVKYVLVKKHELEFDLTWQDYYTKYLIEDSIYADEHFKAKLDKHIPDLLEYDFVVFVHQGTVFQGRAGSDFIKGVESWLGSLNKEFLVAGHIIDEYQSTLCNAPHIKTTPERKYFKLWPQVSVVNIKVWNDCGQPRMGGVTKMDAKRLRPITPSKSQMHDNYTPAWVIRNPDKKYHGEEEIQVNHGWSMINTSVMNDIPVVNIPEDVRKLYSYTYPEDGVDFIPSLLSYQDAAINKPDNSPVEIKMHKKLKAVLNKKKTNTFIGGFNFFNSEKMYADNFKDVKDLLNDVDCIVSPTQGWKEMVYSLGINVNKIKCDYIHYDFSVDRVSEKQWMIENWSGQLADLDTHNILDWSIEKYHKLIDNFPDWDNDWLEFKSRNHYYVVQNLLTEHKDKNLTNVIKSKNYKTVLFMYSDIYQWQTNTLIYGVNNLTKRHWEVINSLSKSTPNLIIEGRAPVQNHLITKIG